MREPFEQAIREHQAGRLAESQALLRRVLEQRPDHDGALYLSGLISHQTGQNAAAIDFIRRAISVNPRQPIYHANLGVILAAMGDADGAMAEYQQAIALDPSLADSHNSIGNLLVDRGQFEQAIAAFERAIALRPNYAEALSNLGNVLARRGRLDEAIPYLQRACALKPDSADLFNNLCNALSNRGRFEEAIRAAQRAIGLRPDFAEAHNNLGITYFRQERMADAIASYRRALELKPSVADFHSNLGMALRRTGQAAEAVAASQRAVDLCPSSPDLLTNLGNALVECGQMDRAVSFYRKALQLNPSHAMSWDALLFSLHFDPAQDAASIFQEHRKWGQQVSRDVRVMPPAMVEPNPNRRLRVGYVSGDFREHSATHFTMPMLANHDRDAFEITCYSTTTQPDMYTSKLQRLAHHWIDAAGIDDERLANRIREDQIDILVDLSLHTAGNRLLAFARRPAPVQATWLGYVGTTGLPTMDWRFSDRFIDPPDRDAVDGQYYSEKTARLADCYWCYDPLTDEPAVSELPATIHGRITFGCLNTFAKVSDVTLELWTGVLMANPETRLMFFAPPGPARERLRAGLLAHGIDERRIGFVDRQPRPQYLETYQQIDICLDTFPYGGGTTTFDALWMGVPTITLAGSTAISRAGRTILSNIGLDDLVAMTREQYIQMATRLAADLPRLKRLRADLRQRLETSPLMDARRFARGVEAAYRLMWQNWCATHG